MITPRPMLQLTVREITSVSATFILSSRLDSSSDPSLSSLGLLEHSYENRQINQDATSVRSASPTSSLIADALSNGLSVTVNSSAWPRTFIRIDEHTDEAVIIIYALMPGRQYDIELGLAACPNGHSQPEQQNPQSQQQEQPTGDRSGTRTLRRQIVTQENGSSEINNDVNENDSSLSSSSSSSSPISTPSSSTSSTTFITPPPQLAPQNAPTQPTLPDRLTQLHQTLSHLTTERDTLLTSLKSLRRESQKADASLRAEIDTLKRTFDKNASFELRSRQKLLALQESVKRAQNGARESEEMTKEVEAEILELMKRKETKEDEHRGVEEEAEKVRRDREDVEEKDKKRVEGMRAELNGLTSKLEKVNGKRERMEVAVIPDLEAKVQDVEDEIEDAEQEVIKLEMEEQLRLQFEDSYLTYRSTNGNNFQYHDGASWSSLTSSVSTPSVASAAARPVQHTTRTHNPRSQSMHNSPVTYPLPHRQSSLRTTSKSMSMNTATNTAGTTAQPSASTLLLTSDQIQQSSTMSSSTRSSPSTSGGMNKGYSLLTSTTPGVVVNNNILSDPLVVGAGRPSRKSFEGAIWSGKNTE